MIQELLGGNNVGIIKGDQKSKHSVNNLSSGGGLNILDGSSSSVSSSATAATSENLRCPRCDSPNTKFCYYNNYNLTQPRHFCKTCRRYWTKGGTLRNVPIGGGCRKNKTPTVAAAIGKSAGKLKTSSSEFIKTSLFGGFEHADYQALYANPNILRTSSQNNYHFHSLVRGSNKNPSYPNNHHFPSSVSVKEEVNNNFLFGSSVSRVTGPDPLGLAHVPSSGLSSSVCRNQTPASQGFIHGEGQNNGLQELFQRLRSPSTSCYYPEIAPLLLGNMASANSSTANSAILTSAPVGTGELGFWSPTLSWSTDLSTANGAYPN